jgi:hypothetical protein
MNMNEDLIGLFREVASQKRVYPYNFTQMIIDAIPRAKPLWQEFISVSRHFQMDKLIRKHGRQFQLIEIQFLEFLHTTPFAAKEIFEILYLQKHLDINRLPEKYKYTEEEIEFMLSEHTLPEAESYEQVAKQCFRVKV